MIEETPVAAPNELRCPYCREAVGAELVLSCERCGTGLHVGCAAETGGRCTSLGCPGGLTRTEPSPVRGMVIRPPKPVLAEILAEVARLPLAVLGAVGFLVVVALVFR